MTAPSLTPYIGFSPQRLSDLINVDNHSALLLGTDYTNSPPQPYYDAAGRNTRMVLTPTDANHLPVEIHYTRLPLTVLNDFMPGTIQPIPIPSLPFTLHGILDLINTNLGLNLSPDEVPDQTFTSMQESYPLRINQAVSLAWIDSDYHFPVVFPVSTVIPRTSMAGFDPVI